VRKKNLALDEKKHIREVFFLPLTDFNLTQTELFLVQTVGGDVWTAAADTRSDLFLTQTVGADGRYSVAGALTPGGDGLNHL
jgi:hypothetical protein